MTDIAELLANLATALGIPVAICVFVVETRRARRERELETYRALSERYFAYLQVVFENPEMSTSETEWSKHLHPGGNPKQDMLVQMAVNLIEAAYFLYRDHRTDFRRAQWDGWNAYLEDWCRLPVFMALWPEVVEQYDEDFRKYVHAVYASVHGSASTARVRGTEGPSLGGPGTGSTAQS